MTDFNADEPTAQPGETKPVGAWFEDMPVTSAHWLAGLVLFGTFVIEAWEMMIIIYSAGAIGIDFELNETAIGTLIGAIFLGMIPGAFIWGNLIGLLGRKKGLLLSIGLYAIFPIASAFAPSYEVLWWIRFFAGVVLSGALVITFPLFTELLPVKSRGPATVYLSSGWPVGVLVAIGVTVGMNNLGFGWREILAVSSASIIWFFLILMFVPESAYWLAEKGKTDQADAVIKRLSKGRVIAKSEPSAAAAGGMNFYSIFVGSALVLTVLSTIINFCFAYGYWGVITWLPTLLAQKGLSAPAGFSFMALSALFMFPGYITASFLTGKLGRKKVMAAFVLLAAVSCFGFAFAQNMTQLYAWNFALSFFNLGAWGVWNTWMGEIYATNARGPGVAWGVMMQRKANTVAPIAMGHAFAIGASFTQIVAFIAAFLVITFLAAIFVPETEGKQLA